MAKKSSSEFVGQLESVALELSKIGNQQPQIVDRVTHVPFPRQTGTGMKLMDDLLATGLFTPDRDVNGVILIGSKDLLARFDFYRRGNVEKTIEIAKWTGKSYDQKRIKTGDFAFKEDSDGAMDGHVLHELPVKNGRIFLASSMESGSLNEAKGKTRVGAVYLLEDDGLFKLWGAAGSAATFYARPEKANCTAFMERKPWYCANFLIQGSRARPKLQHGDPAEIVVTEDRVAASMVIPVDPNSLYSSYDRETTFTAVVQIPRRISSAEVLDLIRQEQDPVPSLLAHIDRKRKT